MSVDKLLDFVHPVKPCTLYLMTTAINYLGFDDKHRMTDYWPRIRDNIINCVTNFEADSKVCIIHFVVNDPGHVDQDWESRLREKSTA